ncbi:MAG: FecR domain-containing protein [Marinilabiliaceae bacterium]|nr:FecR domain-containing protein [Marinilabiliaceae bacterium]
MNRSRLIDLYIKKHQSSLSNQEKDEFDQLRFQHSIYFQWLQSVSQEVVVLEQIKLVDKDRAYQKTIEQLKSPNKHLASLLLKVACSIAILVTGLTIYFYRTTAPLQPIAQVKPNTIQHSAQLITSDEVYELNKIKGDAIDGKDFKLVKNENNHLTYKKQVDTTIFHTVKTATSNQYSVVLSDGSKIHINSNSQIRYPVTFSAHKREVFIEGEVYCDIAKDDIPFIIHTSDNREISVLGTQFNVRNYKEEGYTEVTLVEGKVRVSDDDNQCILKPNQQVLITDQFEVRAVESAYYASWTQPIIRFHNMKLGRVINSFEQLYGVSFQFENPAIKEKLIAGGIVKAQTLQANLHILAESCNLTFIKQSGRYIIKESLSN